VQRWAQDFENKSMALTKAEMAEALFNQLGLNKREARELVDLFFEEVRHALSSGEQVKLSGFGNFDLRDKNQRPGRNPKTGEEIPISARRVVTFRKFKIWSLFSAFLFVKGQGCARNQIGFRIVVLRSLSSTRNQQSQSPLEQGIKEGDNPVQDSHGCMFRRRVPGGRRWEEAGASRVQVPDLIPGESNGMTRCGSSSAFWLYASKPVGGSDR
jgi:integration host factor subunit alpha